jgi:hypothetical protein
MNYTHRFFVLLLLNVLLVTLTGCPRRPDRCKGVVCLHGGVCTGNGSCTCPPGVSGTNCEFAWSGSWNVNENGSMTDTATYAITIERGTGNGLNINNLNNYFTAPIKATITGNRADSIVIADQQMQGKTIRGTAHIVYYTGTTNSQITIRYQVVDTATGAVNDYGYSGGTPSVWTK